MNRNFALAIVLAAAGNAFADDITIEATPFKSTAIRAEVKAQLAASRSSASPWSDEFNQLSAFQSSKSRAEVVSELTSARQDIAAYTGEDSGSSHMARKASSDGGVTRLAGQSRDAR